MKKIITIVFTVIILLYNWLSALNCILGSNSCNLINTKKIIFTKLDNKATIRYNMPISLAFEDYNHFSIQLDNKL